MKTQNGRRRNRALMSVAAALLIGLAFPLSASGEPRPVTPPNLAGVPGLPGPVAAPATPAPDGLKLLKVTPDVAPPGTPFTLTGSGLPPNTDIDIHWSTAKKSYILDTLIDSVDFWGRQVDNIYVVLAKGRTDASGNLSMKLAVPRDFGAIHNIYAVANGVQLAKGGFLVERTYSVKPLRGPIGTTITIRVDALGSHPYFDTAAVIWDNKYVGFISTVTTRGSGTVQIRAAGPVGKHILEIVPASATTPFLNIEQSAISYLGYKRYVFTVTKDNGATAPRLDWPGHIASSDPARTTLSTTAVAGVKAQLSSQSGPVLSSVELTASGLAPGPVGLRWQTARGTRTGAGWNLVAVPLGNATVSADGTLSKQITIPDNVGGWNSLQLIQGGEVKAAIPFYTEWSLVKVPPKKVKAGQHIRIELKGLGFTEMDNIIAVDYDNSYLGYACGFFSLGYTVIDLIATGGPGTHIVDLYPTIYKQKGSDQWYGATPFLNFKRDYPLLALGYRLPAVRVSFEIVK